MHIISAWFIMIAAILVSTGPVAGAVGEAGVGVGAGARAGADNDERILLIVYADHLEEAAREWADYRSSHGWTATSVPISRIAGGIGSGPNVGRASDVMIAHEEVARELRAYIRERYRAVQLRGVGAESFAVLLLGDVNFAPSTNKRNRWIIPTFHFPKPDDPDLRAAYEPDDIATDHPYQLADDKDIVPDFPLGRVPAQTNREALILLEKIRRYEQETTPGPWRRRISYIASEGGFGALDQLLESMFIALVERFVPYRFDITMTYANPRSPYCAPPSQLEDRVFDRLNEGALIVNYLGHGGPSMLDVLRWRGNEYSICDLASLNRLNVRANCFPIVVIIACSTGQFDLADGARSLSEAMLFHPAGPVAIISGSRVTHPYANALFQKNLTEQFVSGQLSTLGEIDLRATRRLVELDQPDRKLELLAALIAARMNWATSPARLRRMHMSIYNLLGDPALVPAVPGHQIGDLAYADGVVTGSVPAGADGEILLTIESTRSEIPRAYQLLPVRGSDDPDLEQKASVNYRIANDKVIMRGHGNAREGRFEIRVSFAPGLEARGLEEMNGLWIKAFFSGIDADGARFDAFGAAIIQTESPGTDSPGAPVGDGQEERGRR